MDRLVVGDVVRLNDAWYRKPENIPHDTLRGLVCEVTPAGIFVQWPVYQIFYPFVNRNGEVLTTVILP